MVKANCKQSKRGPTVAGKGFGAHLLESRPSLPIQTCDFEDKLSEKICSSVSLTISRVFNLCLQVESLTREREALVTESATRALLLERHERCAELFAQVTRARRDLAAQLEGNGAQSVYEGAPPIHEVADSLSNMYITSADIWSALCMERARVVRLENTILAQSRALDRESAVRLKQERRRSQLERELIRTWAGSTKTQQPDNKEVEGTQQRS